jgi:hypothetical protein
VCDTTKPDDSNMTKLSTTSTVPSKPGIVGLASSGHC